MSISNLTILEMLEQINEDCDNFIEMIGEDEVITPKEFRMLIQPLDTLIAWLTRDIRHGS